ncbi:methyltransferase [Planctomycetales bacterium]|nr:methyltransferase [Planctomycetales bacterium]GHT01806.1 methyltransferase [Planctomycetales bacterium]GHT08504.1 methyltransferase [Planctomycetales bacterium]
MTYEIPPSIPAEPLCCFEQAVDYVAAGATRRSIRPALKTADFALYNDDCLAVMARFPDNYVDMIFADPPYNLSNGGFTCQNGRMVSVNKGKWDESKGFLADLEFHEAWISACRRILKPAGTIWVSGTYHSAYQCGFLLQKNGFHLLNDIAWFKPNASPNLSCRFFTASHETVLWARKDKKAKHYFNYDAMKNGDFPEDNIKKPNLQMRSVWSVPTPAPREKEFGKHPTQKPLALLTRIVKASTKAGDLLLDPFNGGGTTGIAAAIIGDRKYIGCEIDRQFVDLTIKRYEQVKNQRQIFREAL